MTDRVDECELGYWLGKPFWGKGLYAGGGRGGMVSAVEVADIRTTMPTPSSAIRWCSPKMLWKGLGGLRTDAGQDL